MVFRSLKFRLIATFCCLAVLLSIAYGVLVMMFAYTVEDIFFERDLASEGAYLVEGFERDGRWPEPRQGHFLLARGFAELPEAVTGLLAAEPQRVEFPGHNGEHYHLLTLDADNEVYLVWEVSQDLVVRPLFRAIIVFLLVVTVILSAITCLAAFFLARRTIRPLTQLSELVANTAPDNLPEQFAGRFGSNEIGILAKALEDALSRVKQFVDREVQFTRDASHELRTPIAVVGGAVELLQQSKDLPTQDKILLERIAHANRDMSQTVEALLALARESSMQSLAVKLLPVVEKQIIRHSHLLEGKMVEVDVDISMEQTLDIPEGVLDILVSNLISNAFQHCLEGEVIIAWKDNRFQISNSSKPMDETLKSRAFEPLVKGADSAGFGLGLSIVKRLCERLGCELSLDSDGEITRVSIDFGQG